MVGTVQRGDEGISIAATVASPGVLDSLHRRPRGIPLSIFLCQITGGRVPEPPPPPPIDFDAIRRERTLAALRAYEPPVYEDPSPVTRALLQRLDDEDIAAVMERLDDETRNAWEAASPHTREQLKLIFGVHHGVPSVLSRTGLLNATPPDDVHAMARGPLAAGGDVWTADLVADAALRHGLDFADGLRVLDFGCSSARHLRVLQAWRPEVAWMGCDPNAGAIAWAGEHLPGIEFFVSPQEPPLALDGGSLDGVFAISVWSHFGAGAAGRWLDEMHRVIRPGGLLMFTAQGFPSLAHYLMGGHIDEEYAVTSAEALVTTGHSYVEAFGPGGDWGVESPEWGTAYLTLEWLAQRALPRWALESYEPARIDANQDLIVLRRGAN